ncbi:MAG: hypothetical protein HQM02_13945, partial [Magnetococcales bacterium]|nr:hypothetical protein [Magnetococcales bacterium]
WWTDLAATRGLDELDAGFEQARIGAEAFEASLPRFLALVQQSGNREWQEKTARLAEWFAAFYAKGQALALAYSQGGATLGNPLMREFDAMATNLEHHLLPFITPAMEDLQAGEYQLDLVLHTLQEVRKVLAFLFFLTLVATAILLAWLVFCMSNVKQRG